MSRPDKLFKLYLGIALFCFIYSTVYAEHLADIEFGDLGANTGWLTFILVNQLSS